MCKALLHTPENKDELTDHQAIGYATIITLKSGKLKQPE